MRVVNLILPVLLFAVVGIYFLHRSLPRICPNHLRNMDQHGNCPTAEAVWDLYADAAQAVRSLYDDGNAVLDSRSDVCGHTWDLPARLDNYVWPSVNQSSLPHVHVCVLASTFAGQNKDEVRAFLYSWKAMTYKLFDVFLISSDGGSVFADIVSALDDCRFHNSPSPLKLLFNKTYGYETSDIENTRLLSHYGAGDSSRCTHFMYTGADNLYNRFFLVNMWPLLQDDVSMAAADFVSAYSKLAQKVKFEVGGLDRGAAVISKKALISSKARFLKESCDCNCDMSTCHFETCDWCFLKQVLSAPGRSVRLGRMLFYHM